MKKLLILSVVTAIFCGIAAHAQQGKPQFSNGDTEHWYYISFVIGDAVVQDMGDATDLQTQYFDANAAAQKWKFVGDENSFTAVSGAGNYLSVKDNFQASANASDAAIFKLETFTMYGMERFAEVVCLDKGTDGNCMNSYGGSGPFRKIGCYQSGDINNAILFYDVDYVGDPDRLMSAPAEYAINGNESYQPKNNATLWYKNSAHGTKVSNQWMEYALPIGNGQFGAMIFGGVACEQVQFNDKSMWTGSPIIRGSYQSFGNVYIEDISEMFGASGAVTNYVRNLDMKEGTANVSYTSPDGAIEFTRQYLASRPDEVVAVKLSACQPGNISVRITLWPGVKAGLARAEYKDGTAEFADMLHYIDFNAKIQVVPVNGTMTTNAYDIEVKNADEVVIYLAGATNYDPHAANYLGSVSEMKENVDARIAAAVAKGYASIYADHREDYKALFDRVSFEIQEASNSIPTDELIDFYSKRKTASDDPKCMALEQLYFNMGRYMGISSERGMDIPANLQGIWNNVPNPSWQCDIHSNINVQMNYWPAENTNLPELHTNFLNYVSLMALEHDQWAQYAKNSGQSVGWTCYTQNNIFGHSDYAENYVIANAWYSTHFWQHYLYTCDYSFLKDQAFPIMLSCTKYWLERLVKAEDGTWVAPQEWSPEHGPAAEDGTAHAQQIVAELFGNTLQALDVLGSDADVSDDLKADLKAKYENLDKGLAVETYDGCWGTSRIDAGALILREWKYSPFSVGEDLHRHQSHLMCLYPFSQIDSESEYFQPAINSLLLRSDQSTGWSLAWRINLWARALDGNHAHKVLRNALAHADTYTQSSGAGGGVYYNLFDAHTPFQIDGNFGTTAAIAEMLLQSHGGIIRLLPSLPAEWSAGKMKGLKAIGNFTVDQVWAESQLQKVVIESVCGNDCIVDYPGIASASVVDENGNSVQVEKVSDNRIKFSTIENGVYVVLTEYGQSSISEIESSDSDLPAEYYNLQGIRIANPQPCNVYIVKQGQKVTKRIF